MLEEEENTDSLATQGIDAEIEHSEKGWVEIIVNE